MDSFLCGELLQEIFLHLPPPSASSVSLVSKRWLRLLRSSTTSLSLHFPDPTIPPLSSFLSHHPFLSSLSVTAASATADSSDSALINISSSCPNLRRLRFSAGPVCSLSVLSSCLHLTSLTITLFRPLCFTWLPQFPSLRELSVVSAGRADLGRLGVGRDAELKLETLCLAGIRGEDAGLIWVWRNCKRVRKLKLKSCEGVGDAASFSQFIKSLKCLVEVELRGCRTVIDVILSELAENCVSLNSLVIYDGCSKEGLLGFIANCRCSLKRIDLRLPLDLDNDHLLGMAERLNFRGLSSLSLQSCCLVTGEGIKMVARDGVEELELINCDFVERESGLLNSLGQQLTVLRKLDLSHNDMLVDKELISMLVSCGDLNELKLRGCGKLTAASLVSLAKSCKRLTSVDIMWCGGIHSEAVDLFLMSCAGGLRRLEVEQTKVSQIARNLASKHLIQVIS